MYEKIKLSHGNGSKLILGVLRSKKMLFITMGFAVFPSVFYCLEKGFLLIAFKINFLTRLPTTFFLCFSSGLVLFNDDEILYKCNQFHK